MNEEKEAIFLLTKKIILQTLLLLNEVVREAIRLERENFTGRFDLSLQQAIKNKMDKELENDKS